MRLRNAECTKQDCNSISIFVVGIFIEILLVFYTWIFDLFEDTYIYITFL